MPNTKISALTSATTPLAGTETVPIVQSGATKQVTVANFTAGRAVAATSLALNGATLTESLSVAGAIRSSGAITANAPGAVLAYQGSGSSYLGAWGATTGTYGTISFYLATSNGAAGNVYATLSSTALTVNPNIVPQVAGNGINFTANTPAAGMTSQLLNWYEEGSYTPTITSQVGSITNYTASAKYTRIGRQVTIEAIIILTNSGTGLGELRFTLPFTPVSDGNGSGFENGNTAFQLSVFAGATSTYASVRKYDSTTIIATNNIIRAGITYFM